MGVHGGLDVRIADTLVHIIATCHIHKVLDNEDR